MDPQFFRQMKAAIKEGNADEVANLIGDDESKLTVSTVFGPWLHVAASEGQLRVAERLVAMGVDVNARGGVAKGTALGKAASEGHLDIVEYLLSCGAEFDIGEPERNPLFGAIYGGHKPVAEFLLRSGIDPHVTYLLDSGKRRNALSYANLRGQPGIAELLKAAGCTVPAESLADANQCTHQQLISMMTEQLGEVSTLALSELFPVDHESHIALHAVRPNGRHSCLTLFTTGMSDLPMKVPEGQEESTDTPNC